MENITCIIWYEERQTKSVYGCGVYISWWYYIRECAYSIAKSLKESFLRENIEYIALKLQNITSFLKPWSKIYTFYESNSNIIIHFPPPNQYVLQIIKIICFVVIICDLFFFVLVCSVMTCVLIFFI